MALDRETVVRTALRLLNEVGLEGLTLRKIAAALDVQAPALYWHFKNKQALLDEMATTVLADTVRGLDQDSTAGWAEQSEAYAYGLRRMLLSYRDGAKVFSGTYLTDSSLYEPMEVALRRATDAGFSLRDAVDLWMTIYCYTVGFAIEEQAVRPAAGERDQRYDPQRRAERIDGAALPLAQAAGAELFGDDDARFARGLTLILRGLRPSPEPAGPTQQKPS
jgi:AcrR family transcriptional regulator